MSSPRRRRVLILAAGATILAATIALPENSLSSATASVFNMSSTSVTAPGAGADDKAPITEVPPNKPATGEIYTGLKPAKAKTECSGSYHIGDSAQCSHGPDKPPAGLDVKKIVAPVAPAIAAEPAVPATAPAEAEVARDFGAVPPVDADSPAFIAQAAPGATAVGPNGVVCEGDGRAGKRIQVLYAREAGSADRFAQYAESFRTWAAGADAIYSASAEETGGVRHIRFVTTTDCKVDVVPVEVPAGAMAGFSQTIDALKKLGFNDKARIYMIFGDSKVYCGIGTMAGDEKPGANNRANQGPSYGRSDSGCWSPGVISHELGHNLGAVNNSAPNSSKAGHCIDDYDIMCYNDGGSAGAPKIICKDKKHDDRLDCNHDDYFSTNVQAGTYLASHWNSADNEFLIRSEPTTPPPPNPTPTASPTVPVPPKPSPTVTPTAGPVPPKPSPTASPTIPVPPKPSPTVTPTPGPTVTPGPGGGLAPLTVADKTANSVTLTWKPAPRASQYGLVVNGRQLGVLKGTAVKLVGLRPGTTYTVQVTVSRKPYTQAVSIRTEAAASGPAAGQWSVMTNAFTGLAVDLLGSRSAANTPAVAWPRNGYANQQWQAVPAAGGTVMLKSRASGKCLSAAAHKAVAGSGVVQYDCAAGDTTQQWKVTASKYGFTLTTAKGDLVVGVGTARQGSARPLVLQAPTGARYQSWAVAAVKR